MLLIYVYDLERASVRLTPSNGHAAVLGSYNGRLSSTGVEGSQSQVVECRGTIDDFGMEGERLAAVENGGLLALGEREGCHQGQNNGGGQSLD